MRKQNLTAYVLPLRRTVLALESLSSENSFPYLQLAYSTGTILRSSVVLVDATASEVSRHFKTVQNYVAELVH